MSHILPNRSTAFCLRALPFFCALCLWLASPIIFSQPLYSQDKNQRPRFGDDIEKIKNNLQTTEHKAPIVFVGSSTIKGWNLAKSFPELPCLNHGFGGSVLDDLEDHFETVIGNVPASAFVIYCGDNDLSKGVTAREHALQMERMLARIRSVHPKTPIIWLGIKPSGKRWDNWPEAQQANHLVAQICRQWPLVRFMDVTAITLNSQGEPDETLFKEDRLHLNEEGYARWNQLLLPHLQEIVESSEKDSEPAWDYQWAWSNKEILSAQGRFWPQFRGPAGDGVVRESTAPTRWSETENIIWKLPIDGRAWSSPVIWNDQIWITNSTDDGKQMSVIVVDFNSGKIIRTIPLFENEKVQSDHHKMNSYASPTIVLDSEYAYVSFGAYGTAAINRADGKVIWTRRDLPCNHYRGPGSSPVLFQNLLIFHMDGFDFKYVVALDRRTGETVWKVDRQIDYGTDDGDVHKAYATPTLIEVDGEVQMISPTSKATIAYDPRSGKEIWRVRYKEFSTTAKAMYDGETLFLNSGFGKAVLFALKPVKSTASPQDLTEKILWSQDRGIGSKPSQLLLNNLIFNVDDEGIASCIDANNGEQLWQKRLGGEFSTSVTAVAGNIYLFDHDGKGYVFAADKEGTLVAENVLADGCMATPAIVQGQLILRTRSALYRIGSK